VWTKGRWANKLTNVIHAPREVTALAWDPQGDLLAIANGRTPTLVLYECSTGQIQTVDVSTGAAKAALPSLLCWCPCRSVLLVGDNRGNFVLFDYRLSRFVCRNYISPDELVTR
jgi:YD repeat-containing protein